jgi:acetoin utilization deacetylase AcuC-like enzyme
MTTLLLTHPVCIEHEPPLGHPERPDRLRSRQCRAQPRGVRRLTREEAPLGRRDDVIRAHEERYVEMIEKSSPEEGREPLDADTWMSPQEPRGGLPCVGAGIRGVDAVMNGEFDNVFCAVRPPGHHAERNRAMGFCLFNSAAVAAHYARARHGAERIAVIDFDVHHGNGTQDIFWSDRDLFYGSTHQMPLYPGTGAPSETGVGNICNAPLRPGDGGGNSATAARPHPAGARGLPARPHHRLGRLRRPPRRSPRRARARRIGFRLGDPHLMEAADRHCSGRLVSMLEGGYDLKGLAGSVAVHVQALMRGTGEVSSPACRRRGERWRLRPTTRPLRR